jgi:NADH:ubiquinone oxidoreductase subunit 3 (subunit A)
MENETTDSTQRPTQNIFLRILYVFLWLVLLRIVTGGFIGAIVGGMAGASKENTNAGMSGNFEAGYNTGAHATMVFMHKYGLIIFLFQILIFIVLCVFGLLPGVGKYKKQKKT